MRRHLAGGGRLLCAERCEERRCQETLAGGAGALTLQEEPSRGRGGDCKEPRAMHGVRPLPDCGPKMAQERTARRNLKESL